MNEVAVSIDPREETAAAAPSPAPAVAATTAAAAPAGPNIIVDRDGRKLKIRADVPLEQELELIAMVGAERAANDTYMRIVHVIAAVEAIDGIMVPLNNFRELQAAIKRVGRGGYLALVEYLTKEVDSAVEGAGADEVMAKN